MSSGCLTLFGLPFLIAGLFLAGLYFSGYIRWWEAQSWLEVPCQIDSTELKSSRSKNSTNYRVEASYHYELNGRTYQSERVTFGVGSDNIGDFHHRLHRELSSHRASGRPFRCFVDPADPEKSVLYRGLRWQMQAFLAVFALTFPVVGVGIVVSGLIGGRATKREVALKERYPEEPWKWKQAWAGPAIPEQSGILGRACDLYTLWSALVIFPLIAASAASGAFATDKWAWLLGIFVGFWCIPAWFTWRRIRKRRVMGKVALELTEMPAWPGGFLTGFVVLQKPLPVYGDPEVELICEKVLTVRTGKGTSTSREDIWRRKEIVPRDRVMRDVTGFRVPVEIGIPEDAPVSGGEDGESQKHEWTLRLRLPVSKAGAVFEVPVFDTGKEPLNQASVVTPKMCDKASEDLPDRLAARKMRAEFASDGTPISIVSPPARNLGMLIMMVLFNVIWTGVAVMLVAQEAPLMFRVIWIVSAAGIWWAIVYQLIHSRRVTFNAVEVVVANRLGIWTRTARFKKSEISGFNHDSSGSAGNTHFYRVRLQGVDDRKVTLADNITESATAEELARRMEAWRK